MSTTGLQARRAHLVQIKRSVDMQDVAQPPRWRIDLKQLRALPRLDQSAIYWLVSPRPSSQVVCVPASLILAIADARAKEDQEELTVQFRDVRSAAIDLGQFLCDLLIGMWIGSAAAEVLRVADGTKAATRPAHLLSVSLREQG